MKKALILMAVMLGITAGVYADKTDLDKVLKQIHWLHHASFMIEAGGKTIYIDPFEIKTTKPADYIFITHSHPDHLSLDDIKKITHRNTLIICTKESAEKLKPYNVQVVKPGDLFKAGAFNCEAVPAYNNKKMFHQKKDGKAGYIIDIGGARVYHAGDTDFIPEMKAVKGVDIALLPIGGFFTQEAKEAAEAVTAIKPKIAVPMHFGYRIGAKKDGELFKQLAVKYARVVILKEEEPK